MAQFKDDVSHDKPLLELMSKHPLADYKTFPLGQPPAEEQVHS